MITTEKNVKTLEFGTGDIGVANAYSSLDETKLENEVCFWQDEPGEINREIGAVIGKDTDEIRAEVRMIFNKSTSVQVLIDKLEYCKAQLIKVGK